MTDTKPAEAEVAPPTGTWQLDPTHSSVEFSVRHLMLSKVRGRAGKFTGQIHVDEIADHSSVVVTIDATSIVTGDDRRDQHVRSADFLDVANHPTIEFRSTAIRPAGNQWRVEGELTLRGTTRLVVLAVEYQGVARDLWGATRAGFAASTEINRKDFGLAWDAVLETGGVVVGDKVTVTLDIQAINV